MARESIAEKIKKLLALAAKAGTREEAASAAAMAQRLMLEHKLTEADLSDLANTAETISEEWLAGDTGKFRMMKWKECLVYGIATLNGCTALRYSNKRMRLIGRDSERRVVEYLSCYLIREVERLALEDYVRHGFNATVSRWVWLQNFGLGAVSVILASMKEERQNVTNKSEAITALVLRDDERLSSYMAAHYPSCRTTTSRHRVSVIAQAYGRKAAQSVSWHAAMDRATAYMLTAK
jgi:hypothetical protein